jgi:DNA mismatch repair protein MutS
MAQTLPRWRLQRHDDRWSRRTRHDSAGISVEQRRLGIGDSVASDDGSGEGAAITPMMAQYGAIKAQYPDCLLFFRMGDFYEMFFDDALKASAALDIALTRRGKHLGEDIPMCGVPVASHEGYVARLIRHGFRVAVCEQLEDPAEARRRGGKAIVARDVVRVITAGTVTEDALLDARAPNYLAALAVAGGGAALAWVDITAGIFATQRLEPADVAAGLSRLEPSELLLAEPLPASLQERPELAALLRAWQSRLTPLPPLRFEPAAGERRLCRAFGVASLAVFGDFSPAEAAAAGALVEYIALTQKGRLPRLQPPQPLQDHAALQLDAATRRNLELTRTLAGERKGSLLSLIDRTLTGAGARLLFARLAAPLTDADAINQRLDAVQALIDDEPLRTAVRALLRRCPDLERAVSRLGLGRGGPRDLAAVRDGLAVAAEIAPLLHAAAALPPALSAARDDLGGQEPLLAELTAALAADLPTAAADGGFIAAGYDGEFDGLRILRDDSRRLILELEAKYAEATGVQSLKIRHNNLLGYYVEVSARHAERLPAELFIHRQTMASARRFTTVELAELERRIESAAQAALARERELFEALTARVLADAEATGRAAAALAVLDVSAGLADLAVSHRYCRPVVDGGTVLVIEGGRHPVVEDALSRADAGPFTANDCTLDDAQRVWLLTGPNMAGKSTFLRQNAMIIILAQTGSFVPADAARIGIVDRLFSRVGAGDDIASGRSTFMVEMVETAAILHQAGPRSFVILDEIGRGTATFDGLSIAWAVIEHLHDVVGARALFATHYHELTALAAKLPKLACHAMRTTEWKGEVVFLHQVIPGAADRSYGVHVARLAGLPASVITRAEEVLALLEADEATSAAARLASDLPLFAAAAVRRMAALPAASPPPQPQAKPQPEPSPLQQALAALDPDALTPKDALDLLYRWKRTF